MNSERIARQPNSSPRKEFQTRIIELLFSRIFAFIMLAVLLIAAAAMIHSEFVVPEEKDWNIRQLREINSTLENFSFAVFGDNKNSVETFGNLIENVNRKNVTFAIDCGDLVFSGKESQYKYFINQGRKFNIPLLTVPGNHDFEGKGREFYQEFLGPFYYSFVIGKSYFIILDDANEKDIDSVQMTWLKDELRKSQDFKNRFVFMHVPLFDPREGSLEVGHSLTNLSFARDLNDLFDENNVTMLFCSHIHGFFNGTWGDTPYIITGGAGAELAGYDEDHYFYHYIRVNVSQDSVEYEVVKLKDQENGLLERAINPVVVNVYAYFIIHSWELAMGVSLLYLGLYAVFIKRESIMKAFGFQV